MTDENGQLFLFPIDELMFFGLVPETTCPHGRPTSEGPCWICEQEAQRVST
jgi:hypothetical protein